MNRIVIALASLACTLAFAATGSAITYGQPDGNRHPNVGAMVADWRKNGHLELFCSGSLISPTVFLTAAHCTSYLESRGVTKVYVTFASEYVEGRSHIVPGTMHTNPGYNWRQSDPGDIAVITLHRAVTWVRPVQLPRVGLLDAMKASGTLNQSTPFTSVGYGVHEPTRGGGPPSFPDTNYRSYAIGYFNALNKSWLRISQNNATGSGGTCYGDSGGPQFLGGVTSNLQVSITVTGDAMCLATNVDYRIDTPQARAFLKNYVRLP